MLVKTYGSAVYGIDATTITVEVNIGQGNKYYMVGLPDNAVKEAWQRIETAIKNIDYKMPRQKIVINMAPADIRKEGSAYDLTMAIGILAASNQIKTNLLKEYIIMGELSLDGGLQPTKGALPIAIQAKKEGFKGIILPRQNANEAAIVSELQVYGVDNIKEAIHIVNGESTVSPTQIDTREQFYQDLDNSLIDLSDVKGHENIKRALEIAAAGGHNLIFIGPPGSGKTMLAKRLPTILPPLTLHEALETTKIHSVAGKMGSNQALIAQRPFRSPHHTISDVALVGGGNVPQPGEISLAHNGVLFLDELPEFKRNVLEVLRQPLEERKVTISRAKFTVDYPASFMLIAAMNPSPSGYFLHQEECTSSPTEVQRYMNKVSGPLLDRMDLHVEVLPVNFDDLTSNRVSEKSSMVRERTLKAREVQLKRFEKEQGIHCNAQMYPKIMKNYCQLDQVSKNLLEKAMTKLKLSTRAYDRIIKVSRTIADLSQSENIKALHVAEAIQYRSLDREDWVK